jgi:hypothetical protein
MTQNSNPFWEELNKQVSTTLDENSKNLQPWNATIAEEFHKKSPMELINDKYFLNLKDTIYPYHIETINELYAERGKRKIDLVILVEGIGSGKLLRNSELVLTPNGYAQMGELKINDFVIGINGEATKIIGVFPQGEKEIVRVYFSDKTFLDVSDDHLWFTQTWNDRRNYSRFKTDKWKGSVKTTKEIRESLKLRCMLNHSIPIVKAIHFNEQEELKIHPYVLGVLLADGTLSQENHVSFTKYDKNSFITEKVKTLCVDKIKDSISHGNLCQHSFSSKSVINTEIKELKLVGCKANTKFIPKKYLLNSIENRIQLLQGLIDCDGEITKDASSIYYYTVSEQLKEDVIFLVQSLGGVVRVRSKIPKFLYKEEYKIGQKCYSLCINLPNNILPVSLPRKVALWKPKIKYFPMRYITKVENVGKDFATCIKVENADGLFVANNCIVTHNTYLAGALEWLEWFYYSTTPDKKKEYPYIDPKSTTAFILMSRDKDKAKQVVFRNVAPLFESQFNKEYFPPNPNIRTYLDIPRNKTLIFPGTGSAASALGFNIFSGIVDEAAFLQQASKGSSSEEVVDQAQAMYEQINGRITSRFAFNGGMVIMITSANKYGSWVENKILDAIKFGNEKDQIFWRRVPIWKAKPLGFFPSGKEFLFNPDTYEIITDPDMVQEYFKAVSRNPLDTPFNPFRGGLAL